MKGLAHHPWVVTQPTDQLCTGVKVGVWMSARGVTHPSPPQGDSNQQPVLCHAVVVPAHSFHQVIAWVAVTPLINAMAEKLESL